MISKRLSGATLALLLTISLSLGTALGQPSNNLDDVINSNNTTVTQDVENSGDSVVNSGGGNATTRTVNEQTPQAREVTQEKTEQSSSQSSSQGMGNIPRSEKNAKFVAGLSEASDLTGDIEGANKITAKAKYGIGFVINILIFLTIALLALRVILDLMYVGIPFLRKLLANGHVGAAPQGGGMQGGMGGMGGFGGGGFGGGFGGGYGGGGFGGGMQGQQQQQGNKIQLVSNAALNAVASEKTTGPDGKAPNPFKIYIKDMMLVLIVTPILIVLAATGVLVNLGLALGAFIADFIISLQGMI